MGFMNKKPLIFPYDSFKPSVFEDKDSLINFLFYNDVFNEGI